MQVYDMQHVTSQLLHQLPVLQMLAALAICAGLYKLARAS